MGERRLADIMTHEIRKKYINCFKDFKEKA